jgi:23S rRNA (pseudouridine1915-N3)-methyltransferase
MRLAIRAVGRLRAAPEQALAADYLERAGKLGRRVGIQSVTLTELAESRAATRPLRQYEEADRLLAALPGGASLITLDERGRELTSEQFSTKLRGMLEGGTKDVVFLIGGPDGHGSALADRADFLLSLGRMTWPHALVRLMLAEQIYRSVTILINHPYHRA